MLKKIILSIIIIAIFSLSNTSTAGECVYDPKAIDNIGDKSNLNTSSNLMYCLEWQDSKLVQSNIEDMSIENWFKSKIIDWAKKIAWFLGLIAVWALVYAAFMMAISGWEEEKIKKAKDIVKWTTLWFLWIVTASSLITIIINFMYSF